MRPLRCLFPARRGNPSVLSSVLLVALGRLRAAFPRPPVPLPTSCSVSFSVSFSVPLSARPSRAQSVPGAAASLLAPPGAAWRRHSELQTFLRNFHSGVIPYLSFLAAPGGAWRRLAAPARPQRRTPRPPGSATPAGPAYSSRVRPSSISTDLPLFATARPLPVWILVRGRADSRGPHTRGSGGTNRRRRRGRRRRSRRRWSRRIRPESESKERG